ncbi:MAG: hypothetical protein ABIB04_04140, partial [Patescibacteria group bacterium]
MSKNPFESFQPPAESKEAELEKLKNLVTYRKGKHGEVTVDLNNQTTEALHVLADTILEHEPDSLLGMQAKLFSAIEASKTAKEDKKQELDEYVAKTKKELKEGVEKLKLDKANEASIQKCDSGFIEGIELDIKNKAKLQNTLQQIAPFLLLNTNLNLVIDNLHYKDTKALVDSLILRQLTSLDLSGNNLGSEGVRALADSPNLRQLTSLDLSYNRLG